MPPLFYALQNLSTGASGLRKILFTKTQRRILSLLFGNFSRRYYGNEIIKLAGVGTGSARNFLDGLVSSGLVARTKEGRQTYYQACNRAPIFDELCGIVLKTFGVADFLKKVMEPLNKQVKFAFIFGSVAKGNNNTNSDIDICIVSESLDYSEWMKLFIPTSEKLGREITLTLYGVEEFEAKVANKNHFIEQILSQPKIMLIGTENDIEEFR